MIDTNLSILNYNFEDIKSDIKNKIKIEPEWADLDLDNNIVDLFITILTYYLMLDVNSFNKMFLDLLPFTTNSERVLYDFSNLIGYNPKMDLSANGEVTFYLDSINNIDQIIIPYGVEITGKNKKIYTVIETKNISIGADSISCEVIQGRLKKERFFSNGNENQSFRIYDKVDSKNIKVSVNAEEWTKIEDLLLADNNSKNYIIKFFNDYFIIMFGNGKNGIIPVIGSLIEIEYFTTDADLGNIYISNVIDTILTDIYYANVLNGDGSPKKVENLKVRNDSIIIGGRNREELIDIKNGIKNFLSYNPYLWSRSDYENYLRNYEKVMDIKIYNGWELYNDIRKNFTLYCYVVLKNKQKLTEAIKQEINSYLNENRKMFNLRFEFVDVEYIGVICSVYVKLKSDKYTLTEINEIRENIRITVEDYFDLEKIKNSNNPIIRDINNSDLVYLILLSDNRINTVDVILQSREFLFTKESGILNYQKSLMFKDIKFGYCYLYFNTTNLGYFDNNFNFVLTNSMYNGKIIVSSVKDTLQITVQIVDTNAFENGGIFYFVSDSNNLNNLIIGLSNIVFVLDIFNFGVR